MAKFDKAIDITLKNEGGFVDDKTDTGGATKFGISFDFIKRNNIDINKDGVVNKGDIITLSVEEAKKLYEKYFWKYDDVLNQLVANKVFDMAVLMGEHQCIIYLQRACNVLAPASPLVVDGVIGAKTVAVVNALDAPTLLTKFKEILLSHFEQCVTVAPQKGKFLAGWQKRAVQ
jgi:lysozyme family protein